MLTKARISFAKSKVIDKLITRFLFVLEQDGIVYHVNENGYQKYSAPSLPSGAVLILARGCFLQTQEFISVRSVSDVQKMMALKGNDPATHYFIGEWKQNRREVTQVKLHQKFIDVCQQAVFVIPASLLLSVSLPLGAFEIVFPHSRLYALKSGPDSFHCVQQSSLVDSEHKAALMLGMPSGSAVNLLDTKQAGKILCQSILKWPLNWWRAAHVRSLQQHSAIPYKALGVVSAAVFLMYQVFATIYIDVALSQAQSTIERTQPEVNKLLDQRSSAEQNENEFLELKANHADTTIPLLFWSIVAQLELENVELNIATFDGKQDMLVYAEGESATTTLEVLLASPYIAKADFASPVRKVRNREQFSIKIELDNTTLNEASSKQRELGYE